MTTPTAHGAHNIADWPRCAVAGCKVSVRAGGVCSDHAAYDAAGTHAYDPDPAGNIADGWRPCLRCGQRGMYHRGLVLVKPDLASERWEFTEADDAGAWPRYNQDGRAAPLDEARTFVRHDARPTSVAAAELALGRAGNAKRRVLEAIVAAGEGGLTDDEVATTLAMPQNTARPRRVELEEAGLVIDSGDTRPTTTGAPAVVWLATLEGVLAVAL